MKNFTIRLFLTCVSLATFSWRGHYSIHTKSGLGVVSKLERVYNVCTQSISKGHPFTRNLDGEQNMCVQMNNQKILKMLYEVSCSLVKKQIEGVKHHESIYQPCYGGNCMNWVLGHIIVARCNIMMFLGAPSIWDMDKCHQYIPGSNPITSEKYAVLFETLCEDLEHTQGILLILLEQVSKEQLARVSGEKTVLEHLLSYNSHEVYHAGELEILGQVIKNKVHGVNK